MNKESEKLMMDEFHPGKFKVKFFYVPQPVAAMSELSEGAKLLYGALYTLAQKKGHAFASKAYLQERLGNPSKSTLYRWQNELINGGLIRVLQRGRGLTNMYFFLCHETLGNAKVGEFKAGARPLYRDRQHGTQTIVTNEEGLSIFEDRLQEWYEASCRGELVEFPKPGIKIKPAKRKEMESKWQDLYSEALTNGTAQETLSSTAGGTEVPDIETVFSEGSTHDTADDYALRFSDEPTEITLPTGEVIKGPSSRACYQAEMKRRKENEIREEEIKLKRMTAT